MIINMFNLLPSTHYICNIYVIMICQYRYCKKQITYGRPDRKFCNKNCRIKEMNIIKEIKSLNEKSEKTKYFIERSNKIHNNKYKYDLTIYTNCRTKVKIICPTHGVFEQTPNNHLYVKHGCVKCVLDAHKLTYISDERVLKLKGIHNNKYTYNDLSVNKGFINITCPTHGMFTQSIYIHEYGHGCPQCNSSSRGEDKIKMYLDNRNIKYNRNHIFPECKNKKGLRFDFYLPEMNFIIEYDGEHHFKENKYFGSGNLEYMKNNDNIKNNYCIKNNITLLRIPYFDYDNIDDILLDKLGNT